MFFILLYQQAQFYKSVHAYIPLSHLRLIFPLAHVFLSLRVHYILNVTREIDNFFPGVFEYHNIRVYDEEATDLLAYWNDTYKFISRAKWVWDVSSSLFFPARNEIYREWQSFLISTLGNLDPSAWCTVKWGLAGLQPQW